MEKVYTHFGVLFRKQTIEDNNILIPMNVARCNVLDEFTFDVEFIGEAENVFQDMFSNDELFIGFPISIEELKSSNDFDFALGDYQNEIFSNLYVQNYDNKNDSTITYKLNPRENKFTKIATFKDNILDYLNEEFEINNVTSIINNTSEKKDSNKKTNFVLPDINMKDLFYKTKENIIGQDEVVKKVVSTIDRNYNINNYRNKTNILLIGPSGSGKAEMFRTMAEIINVPITIEDSEQYSAVGYHGASIEDMLINLYNKANGNLEAAERGILIIDEIDKKITSNKDDVSGIRVINSLLSMMEGTKFRINVGTEYNPIYIDFDTSHLMVVLAGAFSDMVGNEKGIGINNKLIIEKKYKDITKDQLKKYGLSDEFLGRVSIYRLNELSVDNLIEIMKSSKNSALKEYYDYAKKKNVKLYIDDNAIRKIAEIALKKKTGARGIKDTLNEILNDAFADVGINEGIYSSIKITEKTLDSIPPYKLIEKRNIKH